MSSGASLFIHFSGSPVLTIQGSIYQQWRRRGLGTGSGTIDFNGQFKTMNTTVGGPGNDLQIVSPITNGRINKIGPGRVSLHSSGNTFSGTNVVNAGTLAGTSATIGNVLDNDTVELFGFGDIFTTNQINGPGQVVITGQTEYQAAQGYGGGTVFNGGTLIGTTSTLLGNISGVGSGQFFLPRTPTAPLPARSAARRS